MSKSITTPILQSGDCFSTDLLILGGEFKAYVNNLIAATTIAQRFVPRRYSYADYFFVKLYSLCSDKDTHHAAEHLNAIAWGKKEKAGEGSAPPFRDHYRHRRCVPHQTDVDKVFQLLTEREVKQVFGGILDYLVRKLLAEACQKRSWTAIVDNTKYPFYGKIDPQKHIGSYHLPGTKVAWFFQGISLQSENLHLYVDFHSLTKGIYRALNVSDSIAWVLHQGITVTSMLFDREFYRATLVADLRQLGIRTLFPTKKYTWVKQQMHQYLKGTGDFVVGNIFAQTTNQYPFQQMTFVRLVIIGTDNHPAWEIREQFRSGQLTFREAMKSLRGFFTNLRPWKNRKAWARYLVRTYKRRWNIETGFAELNKVHITGRERTFQAKLASLYLRGYIYNGWQGWRLDQIRDQCYHREYTLDEYKLQLQQELEDFLC